MWQLLIILLLPIFWQSAHGEATLDDKYFLGRDSMSYSQAIQTCQSRSMKLISIENKEKNDEVSELMRQKDISEACWISARTLPDRRTYVWLDGRPFIYQNWNPKRNFRYDRVLTDNCIAVAREGSNLYWNDLVCQNRRCYICEYPTSGCDQHQIRIRIDDLLNGTNTDAQTARRKELFISKTRASYGQATERCQDMSMELASIYDEKENDEIYQLVKNDTSIFWTSGYRNSAQDYWKWSDGKNITFYNWRSGEPNNARKNEFCIMVSILDGSLRWMDQPCQDPFRYICQSIVPKVDIIVNGKKVVSQGKINATTTSLDQERPFEVFIDVESAPPTDTRDQIDWDYYIGEDKVSQSDAIDACKQRSQRLLTIENQNKNDLVFKLLEKDQVRGVYWTSASRDSIKSQWKWGNGDPVTYFHWGERSTNPNANGATCIEAHKTEMDVTWSDLPCNETRQYICETTKVSSVNKAGGTLLNITYDNDWVYTNDTTVFVTVM
ncbi:unnamed protein product [Phaedon cochleariae]|uniref:C-type lectin domain-containing protein n=1 Tax=Phaedon cochleariae TaxID=80249 RepID=A0A9P0DQE7_PHACE|nr:unnamed protein product [Phaedon cochleariae]